MQQFAAQQQPSKQAQAYGQTQQQPHLLQVPGAQPHLIVPQHAPNENAPGSAGLPQQQMLLTSSQSSGQNQIFLPSQFPDYSSVTFWNNRYQQLFNQNQSRMQQASSTAAGASSKHDGLNDEWYLSYEQLEEVIKKRLYEDKETEIMILGCGLSNIGAKLYEEDYLYITNVDFSSVVIDYMRNKHQMFEEMDYAHMDITEPSEIVQESFMCIIDKGTLDCVVCNEQAILQQKVESMLENIHRILAPGGSYICVSRGSPETRLLYLQKINWNVEVQKMQRSPGLSGGSLSSTTAHGMSDQQQSDLIFDRIDQEQYYYVYICSKMF